MVTIKGPIKLGKSADGTPVDMDPLLTAANLKVKMPFEATGWESTNIPKSADMTGIQLKGAESKATAPVVESKKPDKVATPEPKKPVGSRRKK